MKKFITLALIIFSVFISSAENEHDFTTFTQEEIGTKFNLQTMHIIYLNKALQLKTIEGIPGAFGFSFEFKEPNLVVSIVCNGLSHTSDQLKPIEQYYANGNPFHATCINNHYFSDANRTLYIQEPNIDYSNLENSNNTTTETTPGSSEKSENSHIEILVNGQTPSIENDGIGAFGIHYNKPDSIYDFLYSVTPYVDPLNNKVYISTSSFPEDGIHQNKVRLIINGNANILELDRDINLIDDVINFVLDE